MPDDPRAQERIPIAEVNQRHQWLYETAQRFVDNGDYKAAGEQLHLLWDQNRAPFYGDPAGIAAAAGVPVPPGFDELKAAEDARIRREAEEQAERERQAAEEQAERDRQTRKRAAVYRRPYFIDHQLHVNREMVLIWACFLLGGSGITAGYIARNFQLVQQVQILTTTVGFPWNLAVVVCVGVAFATLAAYLLGYRRAVGIGSLLASALICTIPAFGIVIWMPGATAFHLRPVFPSGGPHVNVFGLIGGFAAGEGLAVGMVVALIGAVAGGILGGVFGDAATDGGSAVVLGIFIGIPLGLIVGVIAGFLLGAVVGLIVGLPIGFIGFISGALILGLIWGTVAGFAMDFQSDGSIGVAVTYGFAAGVPFVAGLVGAIIGAFGWDAAGWLLLATLIGTTTGVGLSGSLSIWYAAWFEARPSADVLAEAAKKAQAV